MTNTAFIKIMVVVAAMIGLSGCDTLKSAIGMERHVPDETQVASHPALTLPPDYSLRPPGGQTVVSSVHEAGLPTSAMSGGAGSTTSAAAPQQEEPGLLSQIFSLFGGGDDDKKTDNSAPASK